MKTKTFSLGLLATAGLMTTSPADLIGHWTFDEGSGTSAADSSGNENTGVFAGGVTWGSDGPDGNYVVIDGLSGSVIDPGVTLPAMTASNDFTWAFWANSQEAIGGPQQNAIMVGNRYDGTGTDYFPRQFVKFTPTKFEWHQEGGGADNQDYDDLVVGEWHHHAVVKTGTSVQYYRDGIAVGAPGSLNTANLNNTVPMRFFIGGNTGTGSANEVFNGFIDDVRIYDQALTAEEINEFLGEDNLSPSFTETSLLADNATVGTSYSGTIGDKVADANPGDTLTITKVDGPAWLTVDPDGALSGDVTAADAGLNRFTVQVSDGELSNSSTLTIVVVDPDAAPARDSLFGHWPLNEGTGDVAADISGNHFDAIVSNAETGGLGLDGSAWAEDPEFGTVLSFNGVNGTGAFATVGAPPNFGLMPALDLESDFTWSLWARSEQEVNNDVILGNRFAPDGSEYAPREFIKFTSSQFEFHSNGSPQNIDYDDLFIGEWNHHVVVKDGADLTYYRNGVMVTSIALFETPSQRLPVYFGGFGRENWHGYLSDVRLWERALSAEETLALYENGTVSGPETIVITDLTLTGNNDISLTFSSQSGTTYVLESATSLSATVWDEIFDSIPGNEDSTTVTLPGDLFPNADSNEKLFFRVRSGAR